MPNEFRRLVTETLRNGNILMSADELARRMNDQGFRKTRSRQMIDARYVTTRTAGDAPKFQIWIQLLSAD